jgi:light-regulated signal transduction histidine kinase (bacteriophytochrome)
MQTIIRNIALRTSLIYAIAGSVWIIASDFLVSTISDDPEVLTHLQTYKGWFFVATTTLILFFTLKRPLRKLSEESDRRTRAENEIREINLGLEEKVRQRTEQYEEANREMEAFIYSVNHELRAPLRTLKSFIDILKDESAKSLDDEGLRILGIIRSNAEQMQVLIDDLHSLSLVTKNSLKITHIDMTSMVKALCHEVQKATNKSETKFVIGSIPDAEADNTLIKQVWINLINNAVKFSGKRSDPTIIITGIQKGNELIYSIKDNGVGFNPAYTDKLFGAFNRLHSRDDFEGTGIGLSVVRRIIHRHGGRVWAESEPDKGATFWFTLPSKTA